MPRADGCLRRNLKSGQRCITRRFLGLWVSTHACLRCLPPSTPLFRLGWGPSNVLFKLPPSFSYGIHLGSRFNIFRFCPPCHDDVYPFCIQDCGGIVNSYCEYLEITRWIQCSLSIEEFPVEKLRWPRRDKITKQTTLIMWSATAQMHHGSSRSATPGRSTFCCLYLSSSDYWVKCSQLWKTTKDTVFNCGCWACESWSPQS